MNLAFENAADELLLVLTHGPTPGLQEFEVTESAVDDFGTAWATVEVNGAQFVVRVTPLADGA